MNLLGDAEELDWPEHASRGDLVQLDEAARCSVCKGFFSTPLALPCGHSFCSDCIRTNIQFQEQKSGKASCPQCRERADSRQVFPNHPLRDLVAKFLTVRPLLVATVLASSTKANRSGANPGGSQRRQDPKGRTRSSSKPSSARPHAKERQRQEAKRARAVSDENESDAEQETDLDTSQSEVIDLEGDFTPAERPRRKRRKSIDYAPEPEESDDDYSQPSGASPSPKKRQQKESGKPCSQAKKPAAERRGAAGNGAPAGKVPPNWAACPCCNQNFPLAILNDHLDKCVVIDLDDPLPAKLGGKRQAGGKGAKPKLAVPPKLLLSIEKDKALKDRLKKYGLPIKGSRQELEQRYTRFRVEVQMALDRSETSATYASLARRIIARESSEANAVTHSNTGVRVASATPTVPAASSSFDALIKATKARKAAMPEAAANGSADLEKGEQMRGIRIEEDGSAAADSDSREDEAQHREDEQPQRARPHRQEAPQATHVENGDAANTADLPASKECPEKRTWGARFRVPERRHSNLESVGAQSDCLPSLPQQPQPHAQQVGDREPDAVQAQEGRAGAWQDARANGKGDSTVARGEDLPVEDTSSRGLEWRADAAAQVQDINGGKRRMSWADLGEQLTKPVEPLEGVFAEVVPDSDGGLTDVVADTDAEEDPIME